MKILLFQLSLVLLLHCILVVCGKSIPVLTWKLKHKFTHTAEMEEFGRSHHSSVFTTLHNHYQYNNPHHMIIFGGNVEKKGETNRLLDYDYVSNTWSSMSTKHALPIDHTAVNYGDGVIIFGTTSTSVNLYFYHYETYTWQENSPQWKVGSFGFYGYTAVVTETGLMIVFGGSSNDLLTYNINTNTWERITQFNEKAPSPRTRHSAVMLDANTMAIFGGIDGSGHVVNDLYFYDVDSNSWTSYHHETVPAVSLSRHSHAAVMLGGDMYVMSGFGLNDQPADYAEVFVFKYDTQSWETYQITGLAKPKAKEGPSFVTTPFNSILLYGGKCLDNDEKCAEGSGELWELVVEETHDFDLRVELDFSIENVTNTTTTSGTSLTTGSIYLTSSTMGTTSSSQIRGVVYPEVTTGLVVTTIILIIVVFIVGIFFLVYAKLYVPWRAALRY